MAFPFDGTKNDITNYAFQFLGAENLSIAAQVCKNWKFMADDKVHWERLLASITNYRCEGEHPKQTYLKVKSLLRLPLPLSLKDAKNPEFARIFLQTPSLAVKANDQLVGFIARSHPDLIKIIAQDVELSKKLREDVRKFLFITDPAFRVGVYYRQYLVLLKNNDPDLIHLINQDIKLNNLLKDTILPAL